MLIRTCNAMKTNHNDQLHVQHTTNAKYTKYLHLGIKMILGHKCEVLETYQQYLKSTQKKKKKLLQSIEINTNTEYKNEIKNRVLKL